MTDIVERLRKVEELKIGQVFPQEMLEDGNWRSVISAICGEAAIEIDRLRDKLNADATYALGEISSLRATIAQLRSVAGAVSLEGHSYADIKKSLRIAPSIANTGSTDAS